jgi:ABC-type transport system substrate-binding protein
VVPRAKSLITFLLLSALALMSLALTASGSAASRSVPRQNKNVLNIAVVASPAGGVNPALLGGGDPVDFFAELAYDSLVTPLPNGAYGPGLATSWHSSKGNTVWDFKLRAGVKFSDGAALTANAVKQHFLYFAQAKGPGAQYAAQFTSIAVTGPLSFRLTMKTPNPDLLSQLLPNFVLGDIISPKALKDPSQLGTHTAGTGPYMLNPSATISGQTYTYIPNPRYWNKAAVHWQKVVLKVIPDANAQFAALRSGAIDFALGDYATAGSVVSAGFQRIAVPGQVEGVALLDRGGDVVPAMKDIRVRQALNYAIDRQAIAKAQFGGSGRPLMTFAMKGWQGYTPALDKSYPYDPAKAKQLLAEAGYPNGFDLPLAVPNFQPSSVTMAELLASQWSAIGVNAKLDISTSGDDWAKKVFSKKFVGYPFQDSYAPMAQKMSVFANGGGLDLWGVEDSSLTGLLANAVRETNASKQASIYVAAMKRLTDLSWFTMVASYPRYLYARPGLNVPVSASGSNPVTFTVR